MARLDPNLLGAWPRIALLAILATLAGLGCGESRQAEERRAEARRRAAAQNPLPLRMAGERLNQALVERMDDAMTGGTPPFLVHREILPEDEAIERLAAQRLDLVLLSGEPDPRLASLLAKARRTARVLVLGADVVAVLANVTNRSSRVDLEGLRKILRGQATDWSDLAGDTLPLVPYALPERADLTRHLCALLLPAGAPLAESVRLVDDVETQIESTRRTPGGLAVVALHRLGEGQKLPEQVKLLPVAAQTGALGVPPTDRAAVSRGDYPLRLPVVAFLRRGDDPVARRLRIRALGAPAAQRQTWLGLPALPASDRERIRRAWAGEGPAGPALR